MDKSSPERTPLSSREHHLLLKGQTSKDCYLYELTQLENQCKPTTQLQLDFLCIKGTLRTLHIRNVIMKESTECG